MLGEDRLEAGPTKRHSELKHTRKIRSVRPDNTEKPRSSCLLRKGRPLSHWDPGAPGGSVT